MWKPLSSLYRPEEYFHSTYYPFVPIEKDEHIKLKDASKRVIKEYFDWKGLLSAAELAKIGDLVDKENKRVFFYHYFNYRVYSFPRNVALHVRCKCDDTGSYLKLGFMDCLIVIISGDDVSMGIYLDDELVAHKCMSYYITRRGGHVQSHHDKKSGCSPGSSGAILRRHNEQKLQSEIQKYIKLWKEHLDKISVVYFQGESDMKNLFKQMLGRMHIPIEKIGFDAGKPSLNSVKKTYQDLQSPLCHGTLGQFLDDIIQMDIHRDCFPRKVETPCSFISSIKSERRLEKQKYPSLHPELKENLHDSIAQNDYEALMDLYENHNVKQEFIDYLSEVHPKLGSQTFLHYAVKNNLDETTKALLEIGSDPRVKDREGKVPYAYADSEMCEIFMNFRLENPSRYNWTKCHIPAPMIIEEVHRKKLVEDLDAHRRKRKEHRKMKKESRKISD